MDIVLVNLLTRLFNESCEMSMTTRGEFNGPRVANTKQLSKHTNTVME